VKSTHKDKGGNQDALKKKKNRSKNRGKKKSIRSERKNPQRKVKPLPESREILYGEKEEVSSKSKKGGSTRVIAEATVQK